MPTQLTILVIDDDVADVEVVRELLAAETRWLVEHCASADEARRRMAEADAAIPDVVLLDLRLGADSGLDILRQLSASGGAIATVPVILTTGHGSEEVAVEAMKSGAADYLVKGRLERGSLYRAIRNAVERAALARQVEEQRLALATVERDRGVMETVIATCHHLAGPLTALLGNLQLMDQKSLGDAERAELVAACRKAAEQAAQVIRALQGLRGYKTTTYIADVAMLDLFPDPARGEADPASGTSDDPKRSS